MRCVPRFLVARSRQIGADLPREVVEDLTQEVVTLVWRKLEGYRGDAALETWVYRFCDLELRNAIRKGAVRAAAVVHVDPGQLVDQPAEPSAPAVDAERMHRVIDALAADEAAVVRLKHFEQLTFEDVAAALGCSPNTAKTRYYRALGRMRAALARAAAEPGEGAGGGR
ncbi:MAG: RNA polymerase sigma factor [Planctomycetota bacterium]